MQKVSFKSIRQETLLPHLEVEKYLEMRKPTSRIGMCFLKDKGLLFKLSFAASIMSKVHLPLVSQSINTFAQFTNKSQPVFHRPLSKVGKKGSENERSKKNTKKYKKEHFFG
jgi:hypothetical protein